MMRLASANVLSCAVRATPAPTSSATVLMASISAADQSRSLWHSSKPITPDHWPSANIGTTKIDFTPPRLKNARLLESKSRTWATIGSPRSSRGIHDSSPTLATGSLVFRNSSGVAMPGAVHTECCRTFFGPLAASIRKIWPRSTPMACPHSSMTFGNEIARSDVRSNSLAAIATTSSSLSRRRAPSTASGPGGFSESVARANVPVDSITVAPDVAVGEAMKGFRQRHFRCLDGRQISVKSDPSNCRQS